MNGIANQPPGTEMTDQTPLTGSDSTVTVYGTTDNGNGDKETPTPKHEPTIPVPRWWVAGSLMFGLFDGLATKLGVMQSSHSLKRACWEHFYFGWNNWISNSSYSTLSLINLYRFLVKNNWFQDRSLKFVSGSFIAFLCSYIGAFTFLYLGKGGTPTGIYLYKEGCHYPEEHGPTYYPFPELVLGLGMVGEGAITLNLVLETYEKLVKLYNNNTLGQLCQLVWDNIGAILLWLTVAGYGVFSVMSASKMEMDRDKLFTPEWRWVLTIGTTIGYWGFYIECISYFTKLTSKMANYFSAFITRREVEEEGMELVKSDDNQEEKDSQAGDTHHRCEWIVPVLAMMLLAKIFMGGNPFANLLIGENGAIELNQELYKIDETSGWYSPLQVIGGATALFNSFCVGLYYFNFAVNNVPFIKDSVPGQHVRQVLRV